MLTARALANPPPGIQQWGPSKDAVARTALRNLLSKNHDVVDVSLDQCYSPHAALSRAYFQVGLLPCAEDSTIEGICGGAVGMVINARRSRVSYAHFLTCASQVFVLLHFSRGAGLLGALPLTVVCHLCDFTRHVSSVRT